MNRRIALMLTMLLGTLVPGELPAQESRTRRAKDPDAARSRALRPAGEDARGDDRDDRDEPESTDEPPSGLLREPGFQMRTYDIARYTRIAQGQQNPQKALVDWIFRRTGTADWHGDKIAVLSASKSQIRAYHSPEVLKQVSEVVERFVNAQEDILAVHVRFFVTNDTRWRHSVFSQLTAVGSGPQGQQIWTMRMSDAALVISQMQTQQGFRKLADERVEMVNGQTLTIRTAEPRTFAGGMQRESAAGQGYTPRAEKLDESIILKLSPLLTFEADAVDGAIDLTVNTVRTFHRTKVIAPREMGPPEMAIDVPEVSMTHLDQTVKNWPLGQTLLVTGGIHPGILDKKGGWLGTPLGAPTSTEVLVFLDAEIAGRDRGRKASTTVEGRSSGKRDSRASRDEADAEAEDQQSDPEPPPRARKTKRSTRGPDLDADGEN
ncbi:MAG: hypothetical protein U0790_11980 [Isosphaeraceae bacterium]